MILSRHRWHGDSRSGLSIRLAPLFLVSLEGNLDSVNGKAHGLSDLHAGELALRRQFPRLSRVNVEHLCDFVIAAESIYFSQPEIDVGCYPPIAAAAYPRMAGSKIAMDMVLTGRKLSAKEAQAFGLITRVVPDDELENSLKELLDRLTGKSRSVLSLAKKAVSAGTEWEFNLALTKAEDIYIDELLKTEDLKEGLNSFAEKRKPEWKHK
ncbi:MAG: enoyl-CoA hydratase/isomerase family protein [Candidatus Marinimicrobia bacterium]|nr:enoyl-CoA hydratase/isomerase family protein [Candidatus Neomarinimicrobiota bacterium]